jgi:hypothetical protein
MHVRKSRKQWQAIVRAFERSGDSHEKFCAAEGINVGNFRAWLYRLRRQASARSEVQLVPVEVVARSAPMDAIVVVVGGVEIRVPAGTDPAYLARLVGELRGC